MSPRAYHPSPHPPRLPHLHLDDGRELAPRRVPDDDKDALDDDGRQDVEALVRLSPGKLDGVEHAGRSRGVDAHAAVNLVGSAVRDEDKSTEALSWLLQPPPILSPRSDMNQKRSPMRTGIQWLRVMMR